MSRSDLRSVRPNVLATLLAPAGPASGTWSGEELGHVLEQQLALPLSVLASHIYPDSADAEARRYPEPKTVAELLQHPRPPMILLRAAKDWAKASLSQAELLLPPEVSTALYYGALSAALVRHGQRISRLGDDAMSEGLRSIAPQAWLPAWLRELLGSALKIVGKQP